MSQVQRQFILGEEWLYIKIYTGYKTSDYLLTQMIKPISQEFIGEKLIHKWFFIRYGDPHYHLRVRFHLTSQDNLHKVTNRFAAKLRPLIDEEIIWKVQADTYVRELERYGFSNIESSEELFFHDTVMVVEFLELIDGLEGEKLRWLFALKSIHSLLNSFKFNLDSKIKLMERLRSRFGREFNMNRKLKKQLDKKYRVHRKEIEDFIYSIQKKDFDFLPIQRIIDQRSINIDKTVVSVLKRHEKNELGPSLDHLLGSYVHMTMNRLFKSKARMHEMVCYDFLSRTYISEKARKDSLSSN